MTLLNQKRYKIFKIITMTLLLGHSIFSINPAFCDFSLDDFRDYTVNSGLSSPYSSGSSSGQGYSSNFDGQIPLKKQNLTPKDREEMRLAREELNKKKIPFSAEEFIKQIKKGKIENVKLMMRAGMSPNTDYFGEYALYYAARKDKTEIALYLIEKGAAANAGFDSPLFWTAKNGNFAVARALVENGARLDYTDLVSSKSILYTAIKNKNYDIAKLLLESGAKMDKYSAYLIKQKNLFDKLGVPRF